MKRNYCKPILSLSFAIIITLTLLANNSEATPADSQRLFNLTDGQHTGLAYDGTYFYVSSRKDDSGSDPSKSHFLRKYDFSGDLIFEVDLATQVLALEYIDNTLYGIQHSEPPKLIIFNNETGDVDSISDLPDPLMDPVGLAKVGSEFYVLGFDDLKPFSFMVHVFDGNWVPVKVMEYIVGLQVAGTISGFTSIGDVLFITIFSQDVMWKAHSGVEGFVIDIYTLPFIGSAALATDGTYIYAASADRASQQASMHKISLTPLPCPSKMYIQSIIAETVKGSRGQQFGKVTVTVFDDCSNPVSGAAVTGTFAGAFNETTTPVITNSYGVAVIITTAQIKKPSYTFCVDNLTGTLTYDLIDNVETCKSN